MPTIAVDWDLTLWDTHKDDWMPGAVEALRTLSMGRRRIIIHSCRSLQADGYKPVRDKLGEVGLLGYPLLEFWDGRGKPEADLYVDDKGYRFEGDWRAVLRHPALAK